MKFVSLVSILVGALVFSAPGLVCPAHAAVIPAAAVQDAAPDNTAASSVSGNWQIAWTARNGSQRQATMEIKQHGSKLSGQFEGERGSVALKGKLDGDQITLNIKMRRREISFSGTVAENKMSGTTEGGVPWSATRQ